MAADFQLRASIRGHALSQHELGMMHWTGTGVEQSDDRARALWRMAAEAGLAGAQVALANSLKFWRPRVSGPRGQRNDAEARMWYERAAAGGHTEAALVLRMWDE